MDATYRQETNLRAIIWVALTCVFTGALIGGTTNAINGYVSPLYFQNILGWNFPGIWEASIAQGIFEGLLYGAVFSIVFGSAVAILTKGQATYRFSLRHILYVAGLVVCCWMIGGLVAMGLAALSPEFYRQAFRAVPRDYVQMLKYAWVGGSVWGGIGGGILGLIAGVLSVWKSWKNYSDSN